jgi:hypothetical protein
MAQPGKRPLHDLPSPVPPQLPSLLLGRPLLVGPGGNARLDAPAGQPGAQRVAILAPLSHQPFWALAGAAGLAGAPDGTRVQGCFQEGDRRRGCRVQVGSPRRTRAIDPYPPLWALAPRGRADLAPPFFAGAKLPAAKPSSQRSCCRSLRWAKKARQSLSSTPLSSQAGSRRQQVLGLPYRRGSALDGAPVQKIQRMPSKQRRSSTAGRPPLRRGLGGGNWTRICAPWTWVSFRPAMSRPPFFPGDAWRDATLTGKF